MPSLQDLQRNYTFYHGAGPVPQYARDAFRPRRQYIGQVELAGALTPYLSLPQLLSGRRVIHFIDNTAALAGLMKGYSRVLDCARFVHAFHAWNVGARATVWFEYVVTDANPADEPSRDLRLADSVWEVAPGITSSPVPIVFPPPERLVDPSAWMQS